MQLDLTTMPIPQATRRIALPASVGFLFLTLFNVVDTWFAGQISTGALAALSRSFPVYFIVLAAGNGLSTGATACIGASLGAGDRTRAAGYAVQALLLGAMAGVLLGLTGLALSPALFRLLGADEANLVLCLEYMDTIFLGAPAFLLVFMANAVLQAMGDTRRHRNFLILSFFLNCILDPWFIHGGLGLPAMGVRGVALATVACNLWGVWLLGRGVQQSGILQERRLRDFRIQPELLADMLRQGLPSAFTYLTIGLGIFVITFYLSRYGDAAVAAYGVATRIEQLALLPAVGLNVSTLALTAQNHGAGKADRILATLRHALILGAVVMAAGGCLVYLLADPLMAAFTADAAVVEIGAAYLRLAAFILYAYVVVYVHVAALQGIRKPMFGVWVGVLRQLIAPILLFHLGVFILEQNILWIWWSIFAITWAAALCSAIFGKRILFRVVNPVVA
ncbi:MATE family efflux transporter [Megalodesulfovibrio gigas]|uniref:Multidrug-efflux transporter n=1 Tax=Megalodesulfovibrio gigas (strain ATCC 19364 / DSM 1382 / NCIMB 9332 / VKM B-1759) TaxID=1121448 RepID=T2GDZ4_MEGG1|nr:MATE family efflux transporter [Megalodesulfovibrio gigas]AGW14810.1 putative MATE efflux family protein [Megalodesulfovibrio gigas DSM 1382 = ATCC 19364]